MKIVGVQVVRNMTLDMGKGDGDSLVVSASSAKKAVLNGGAGVGDKLYQIGNRFATKTVKNFESTLP